MTRNGWVLAAAGIVALIGAGCATSTGGGSYSRDNARKEQSVRLGTVVSVSDVTIEGTPGVVGGIAGGVLGGVLGHTIGKGTGKAVATGVGVVGGAVGGAAVEKGVTKKPGWEITVKLDNGETIAVVQQKEPSESFEKGDRVRILKEGDTTRVRKETQQ